MDVQIFLSEKKVPINQETPFSDFSGFENHRLQELSLKALCVWAIISNCLCCHPGFWADFPHETDVFLLLLDMYLAVKNDAICDCCVLLAKMSN